MAQTPNIFDVETDPAQIAHPALAFLLNYWNAKRGDRLMPKRSEIHASEIKQYLPWIFIVEAVPEQNDYRYRLIGTLVTQYFQLDATGKTVREAFGPAGEAVVQNVLYSYDRVMAERKPLRVGGKMNWMEGNFEEFDSLYLPLSDDGENANVFLGAFVFDEHRVLSARQVAKEQGGRIPERVA